MKKSELKNLDIVVYDIGLVRLVCDGKLIGTGGHTSLDSYEEDLINRSGYSINSVYRLKYPFFGDDFKLGDYLDDCSLGCYKLIWERKKDIKVTLNPDYVAIVNKKEIKVGCQTFSHEKLDELHSASLKVRIEL